MKTQSESELIAAECYDKRHALIAAIEECENLNRALKEAAEKAKRALPEFTAYQRSRYKVAILHAEYNKLSAAFKESKGIAS
jgi:hypothetical protein